MTTYEVIQHQEVGAGGAASITFSSIPQTYTDLQVLVSARDSDTNGAVVKVYPNGSSANASIRQLLGNGSSASSGTSTTLYARSDSGDRTANTFGSCSWYITNYTSSAFKSVSIEGVEETNGTSAYMNIAAGLWSSTDPITSLQVVPGVADFKQYSSATLIGIKKAALPAPTDVYSDSLLEEVVLTSSAASVTFSGLDAYAALGYTNLQIRSVAKAAETANDYWAIAMRFNGDSSTNYSSHRIMGNGSTVASSANTSTTYVYGGLASNSYGTNPFGASICDILDFADSSKYKTSRSLHGVTGALYRLSLESGNWRNTAPITSINLSHSNGSTFIAGSRFSLYGSK